MSVPVPSGLPEGGADGTGRRILLEVLRGGPVSRAELARRLDLSTPSLTRLTKPLVADGLLVEGDARVSGAGRPSRPLDVAARFAVFLGFKLVGDAIFAVVTDVRGTVLAHREEPLIDPAVDAVVDQLVGLTRSMRRRFPAVAAMGVAVGGPVRDRRVAQDVIALGWTDVDLGGRLQDVLGLPTVITNDAYAFVRAEHWFGVGRGSDPFLAVTVGFGVGCCLVAEDQVIGGRHGVAGWVRHLPLDADGPRCDRGHRGCPEVTLTTGALLGHLAAARGEPVTADGLRRLAAAGDPVTQSVLDGWARSLGRLVAVAANLADPQRIMIAGEDADLLRHARPAFDAGLAELRRPGSVDDLAVAPLEFSSWARGAAVAAVQRWVLGGPP